MPHAHLLAACLLAGVLRAGPPAPATLPVADHQAEQHAREQRDQRLHRESLDRLDTNRQQAQFEARSQQIQQLDRRR